MGMGFEQGFSIIFPCGPQRAKDRFKIDVLGPNDHNCPMYFYVYWSWQSAKQVWSAGWIWPRGRHLRRPGFEARASHPCPTQIWVPPPRGYVLYRYQILQVLHMNWFFFFLNANFPYFEGINLLSLQNSCKLACAVWKYITKGKGGIVL